MLFQTVCEKKKINVLCSQVKNSQCKTVCSIDSDVNVAGKIKSAKKFQESNFWIFVCRPKQREMIL